VIVICAAIDVVVDFADYSVASVPVAGSGTIAIYVFAVVASFFLLLQCGCVTFTLLCGVRCHYC